MSKAQYDIYVGNVLKLTRRLIVKNSLVALTINRELMHLGHEIFELNPETWKYYLNLSGQYHSTDLAMEVTSLDTLQTIAFTKENLALHVSTAREYALEERSFLELLKRFPNQELLIRGILHPIDINTAIEAEDGEILYYDPELVEENETNLIPRLSTWSRNYMQRWNNKAYFEIDDLYVAAQFGGFFLLLPSIVLNIRLSNCHTRFVHSFHIREYLASNGRLDVYTDHMTKKQMLWLYRNIRYIHHHAGKQDTFHWLVENVLTDRGLPLAEWSMRHNLEDQVDNIYARVEFERKPINFGYSSSGADRRSVELMLDAEQPLARGNKRIQREAELVITETMENSLSDKLRTKILESSVLDTTDSAPYTLSDALLNHWIYWSFSNRYTTVIMVDNPKTGATLQLTVKEAFLVYLYCYNVESGYLMDNLPIVDAHLIRRIPAPTFADLRALVQPALVKDEWITGLVDAIGPIKDVYLSTAAFNDDVRLIHKGQLKQRALYCAQEHFVARGEMEVAMLHCYEDIECDFGNATTFTSWFAARGLDIATLTVLEAGILSRQIIEKATGADLRKADSLKEMQAAMLRLMAQLSSYSIQYLQDINDDRIRTVDWPVIRVGDIGVEGFDYQKVDAIDAGLVDYDLHGMAKDILDLSEVGVNVNVNVHGYHRDLFDLDLITEQASRVMLRSHVEIATIDVIAFNSVNLNVPSGVNDLTTIEYQNNELVPLEGAFASLVSNHYSLTLAERLEIANRWAQYQPGQLWIDISTLINERWMTGFWPSIHGVITQRWLSGFNAPDASTWPSNIYLDIYTPQTVPLTLNLPGFASPYVEVPLIINLPGFDQEHTEVPDPINLPGFTQLHTELPGEIDLPGFDLP